MPRREQHKLRKTKLDSIILCLAFLLMLTLPVLGYAMTVTLAWDANPEPDLAGYKVYYGLESSDAYDGVGAADGDSPIDMPLDQDEDPDPNVVQFTVYDLPEGTCVFAVTAYNSEDLQSDYSNEVISASETLDELSTPSPQPQVSTVSTSGGEGGGCSEDLQSGYSNEVIAASETLDELSTPSP